MSDGNDIGNNYSYVDSGCSGGNGVVMVVVTLVVVVVAVVRSRKTTSLREKHRFSIDLATSLVGQHNTQTL